VVKAGCNSNSQGGEGGSQGSDAGRGSAAIIQGGSGVGGDGASAAVESFGAAEGVAAVEAASPKSKAVAGVSKAYQALTSAASGALRLEVKAGPSDDDGVCEVFMNEHKTPRFFLLKKKNGNTRILLVRVNSPLNLNRATCGLHVQVTRMRCCRTWYHVSCLFAHEAAMRSTLLRCPICRDTTTYPRQVRQVRRDMAQKEAAETERAKKEAKLATWLAKQKAAQDSKGEEDGSGEASEVAGKGGTEKGEEPARWVDSDEGSSAEAPGAKRAKLTPSKGGD
jgi:hypothetical protein